MPGKLLALEAAAKVIEPALDRWAQGVIDLRGLPFDQPTTPA